MSIKWIGKAFEVEGLSPVEKLILIKLADNASDDGRCFPSQSTIARHCNVARETVNRAVKVLRDKGILSIEQRTNANGRASNIYTLICDPESQGVVTRDHPHSDQESHTPVTQDHIEPIRLTVKEPLVSSTPKLPNGKECKDHIDIGFVGFWKTWPRKINWTKAYESYRKAVEMKKADMMAIQHGAEWMAHDFQGRKADEGEDDAVRGTPHATTWLNQNRWEDDDVQNWKAPKTRQERRREAEAVDWEDRAAAWASARVWAPEWGRDPSMEGCEMPQEVRDRHKIDDWGNIQ